MKKLLISALATAFVASFAISAEAAGNKQKVSRGCPGFMQSSSSQEVFRHPLS
jgi:hypothetical protein